jgi:transitional endoplasmic reticulum ATPase
MLLFHLKGRITAVDIEVGTFARQIAGQGYSSSDLKLMVDEAAKIAMRVDLPIRHEHLEAAAADSVPPSISDEVMARFAELKKEVIRRNHVIKKSGLSDLAGMSELKQMLLDEVVAPLLDPDKFRKYGITIPNGILMYGPPGCGKTFVAQRLAEELNRNFYEVGPSAVGSIYMHGTGLKIRQHFDAAAASAPSLMFVDEFEGMVPARSGLGGEQQYKAEEVSEWLMQIGSCAERGILLVAATNEPWSIDTAVQRSGRLDKKIYVGPPDEASIMQMLQFHLKERLTAIDIELGEFSQQIAGQGYAASDIKLLVDEAAKIAMLKHLPIRHEHLETAAAEKVPPSISDEAVAEFTKFTSRGANSSVHPWRSPKSGHL